MWLTAIALFVLAGFLWAASDSGNAWGCRIPAAIFGLAGVSLLFQ